MGLGSDPSGGRGAGDDGTSGSSSSRGDGGGMGDSGVGRGIGGYASPDSALAAGLRSGMFSASDYGGFGAASGYGGYGSAFSRTMSAIGNVALKTLENVARMALETALGMIPGYNAANRLSQITTGKGLLDHAAPAIVSKVQAGMTPQQAIADTAKDPAMGLTPEASQSLLDNADKIGMSIENDFSSAIANYNGDMNEGGGVRYGPEQYAYADSIKTSDPEGYKSLIEEMNRVQGGNATPDFSSLESKYAGGAKVQAPAPPDPLGGLAPAKGASYTDQLQNVLGGRGANTVAQGQRFDEFGRMQTGRDRRNTGPPNNRVSTREEDIPKDWSEFVQFSAKRNRQQRADQSLIPQQNNAMMLGGQDQAFQGFDFSVGK